MRRPYMPNSCRTPKSYAPILLDPTSDNGLYANFRGTLESAANPRRYWPTWSRINPRQSARRELPSTRGDFGAHGRKRWGNSYRSDPKTARQWGDFLLQISLRSRSPNHPIMPK